MVPNPPNVLINTYKIMNSKYLTKNVHTIYRSNSISRCHDNYVSARYHSRADFLNCSLN